MPLLWSATDVRQEYTRQQGILAARQTGGDLSQECRESLTPGAYAIESFMCLKYGQDALRCWDSFFALADRVGPVVFVPVVYVTNDQRAEWVRAVTLAKGSAK